MDLFYEEITFLTHLKASRQDRPNCLEHVLHPHIKIFSAQIAFSYLFFKKKINVGFLVDVQIVAMVRGRGGCHCAFVLDCGAPLLVLSDRNNHGT